MLRQIADEAEAIENEHVTEIRSSLKICLQQFSQPHQKLLLAPYLSGGQVKRIANDCGKSVNALYKLLGRLRQKLSTCIESRLQAGS
ncbi:RNA polymerase ECF-type sigma factor [Rhodopirellula sallentina SM41]|uniref:RNA polymerase ECF-type sigma factor n=1 Tax=Rhodopirellula sallentina SM41 TaxID=1263870 RepID=M5U4M5_9BACT|nr:RNA polymerase ECF-type sigma factor [Rhodopirellula sallentina SM41]